jgi:hypothetical protein
VPQEKTLNGYSKYPTDGGYKFFSCNQFAIQGNMYLSGRGARGRHILPDTDEGKGEMRSQK